MEDERQKFFFEAPDLSPIQQARVQEVFWGQAELAAARAKGFSLLEILRGFLTWPQRMIFIRRLRHL